MVRKYDRYGLNRQFKAKPCAKKHPFPYRLPFVDDFGLANEFEKTSVIPETFDPDTAFGGGLKRKRSKEEMEEMWAKRRATNVARKLGFDHPMTDAKRHQLTRRERRMNTAFYYIAGSILTGGIVGELGLFGPAARMARRGANSAARWRRRMDGGRYHLD